MHIHEPNWRHIQKSTIFRPLTYCRKDEVIGITVAAKSYSPDVCARTKLTAYTFHRLRVCEPVTEPSQYYDYYFYYYYMIFSQLLKNRLQDVLLSSLRRWDRCYHGTFLLLFSHSMHSLDKLNNSFASTLFILSTVTDDFFCYYISFHTFEYEIKKNE